MPILMEQWMTPSPHTIGAYVSLAAARCMMADFAVGHLPVRREGELVGVITRSGVERLPLDRLVVEAMEPPFCVAPTDTVESVVREMARVRTDAAIVVAANKVVGIFTATDAERALATALRALDARS
jgi:acetoin utilization protein AcuB